MFRNRKQNWNPYTSDIRRISIYPSMKSYEKGNDLKVGDTLTVNVYDIDEQGRGVIRYRDVKIIIPNATSGSRVKVRVVKIYKDTAIAHIIEVLNESNTEY